MTTTPTPNKSRRDPLAAAKMDSNGTSVVSVREQVVEIVDLANKAHPDGVPTNSPFSGAVRERLNEFANTYGLGSAAAQMAEDELRLVVHYVHSKRLAEQQPPHIHQGERMRGPISVLDGVQPQPDRAPIQAPKAATGVYLVLADRRCSLKGQMFWVKAGSYIREADYMPGQIQAMIGQGLQLKPLTE
jgi:rhodanese-related sulfurtransferase